tara:strand:+ start:581 stop:841 length:261 start_codon:yes stop_codon:yes gene_type:complete
MNKFTNNQYSEETTAAYLYELEQAHRQEEQELTEIADAQWEAFQNDHDDYGDELDEHDLQIAQAEWEAEQDEPFGFMAHDDPDYWA